MSLPRPADLFRHAARNDDYGRLQEIFLIVAITTILVIRTQLWLTNYPQLGGGGLHIAHLLYGGIFMVIAIGIAITLLGRRPRLIAAIVGGVGFGFFIDELGKFITSDNDYFFEPAAALIYLIFVGLFMLARWMRGLGTLSPGERLANAIDIAADASRHPLDEGQKRHALALLADCDPRDPLVERTRALLAAIDAVPAPPPSRAVRLAEAVRTRYLAAVETGWFRRLIGVVFAVWALGSALLVIELVLSLAFELGGARAGFETDDVAHLSFLNWASMASSLVSGAFVIAGLVRLRRGARTEAYRMFERALLVAIFVTRVFSFIESQFGAVFGLAVDLLLLATVSYMAAQEARTAEASKGGPTAPASGPARTPATTA